MSAITLSLITSILLLVLGQLLRRLKCRMRVPGPLLPPSLKGHLLDFITKPKEFGPSMVAKYGPIYRFWTNNFTTQLALADPAMAQQLYRDQSNMHKPRDGGLGAYFQRFLGTAMGLQNGRKWTMIRKAFKGAMSPAAADKSLDNIEASLNQWEQEILEPLARSGEVVTIPELVGILPLTLMMNVFFGHQFVSRHSERVSSLARDAVKIAETTVFNRWACSGLYKFLPTKENMRLKRFHAGWDDFLHTYKTSEERRNGEGGVVDSVIEMNISSKQDISFEEVKDTLTEIIFTNVDVIKPAISWLLADLLVYPEESVSLNLANQTGMIDKAMLENHCPRLLNVIKESARVHPFFPISLPEILNKDVELGGLILPKGSWISIDQYSINFNPIHWTKPSEFCPERFEDIDDFRDRWAVFRFGYGARRCYGQYYGNLMLANVTARLLSNWQLVPLNMEGIHHHDQVPRMQGIFAMLPDIRLRLGDQKLQTQESYREQKD